MSYQLNKSHLLICIFAGVVLAGGFVWQIFFSFPHPLFGMAMWVSLGIVIFYVIGYIARYILINSVFVRHDHDYDFSQDEEYQSFVASLETQGMEPMDLMTEDPLETMDSYDDTLDDPFMEPVPLDDAS